MKAIYLYCLILNTILLSYNLKASEHKTSSVSGIPRSSLAALKNQSITNFNDMSKVTTDADFSPGAKASSGLAVTYTSDNPAVATIISGTMVHIVGAGIAKITASQVGNATYAAKDVEKTLTVKISQTILNFPSKLTIDGATADYNPGATATSGLTVTYTSSDTTVAKILGGTIIHIVGAGKTTIKATQLGNEIYAVSNATQTLTVTKANQTITFSGLTTISYTQPDFSPFSSPSGTIVYYSSNIKVLNVVNGKLHVTGVGQATIIASSPSSSKYNVATDVSKVFTVTKADQTIVTNGNINKTYNDPDFSIGANASSGLPITYIIANSAIAVSSFDQIRIKGAGTTSITISQGGNENFNSATATITLTVAKATQEISFPAFTTLHFGDPDFNPGAATTQDLPITYTSSDDAIASVINNLIHIVSTGQVQITAHQTGNGNYLPAPDVSQILTINKTSQIITLDPIPSKKWGDQDFDLNANTTSGLPLSYSSTNTSVATVSNGKVHLIGVGSTTITVSQPGNSNFESATAVSQLLQVNKVSQSINFSSIAEKAIGQSDFVLTASATSGLSITYTSSNPSVATISGNTVHIAGSGITYITATQGGNIYYLPATSIQQALIVKNSAQSISFGNLPDKTYGDADFTISATSSSGLPVYFISDNTLAATISGNTIHIIGAGSANIIALQDGNSNFAAATPLSQLLKIEKANQAITFIPVPIKTYNSPSFVPVVTSNSGLQVEFESSNEDVAIIIGDRVYITGVGTAIISAKQTGNNNFNQAITVNQTLTVSKSSQLITFNPIPNKTLGNPDFEPDAYTSSYLPITYTSSNPSVATIVNNKIHIVGVGISEITASQTGNANFVSASDKTQILTINKANQTINFDALGSVKYGSPDFSLFASSSSNLPISYISNNPIVATITNGVVHILNSGTTYISAMQNGNDSYNAAPIITQTLVVEKASQAIVFDSIYTKKYGDLDFGPGAFSSAGLPVIYTVDNPNVAMIINGKVHIIAAGKVIITVRQSGNNNYSAADEISRVIKIDKATIIVRPDNITRNYKAANPSFSCTYSGFVNFENESKITTKPTITTIANIDSYPGTYDLNASGAMADNYDFVYQKGIFLILGTLPLKTAKAEGNELLCINPADQKYTTEGATFASDYIWSLIPKEAGQYKISGKTLNVNFDDSFTGKVSIIVKAINAQGIGEQSDSLFVYLLAKPHPINISYRGSFCSVNTFGDSIIILNSETLYRYQLHLNDENFGDPLIGNGSILVWYDLKSGKYSITENVCDELLSDKLEIKETSPLTSKPQLVSKWNDVIVCIGKNDSIESYRWFKDGALIKDEVKQYLWTNKNEGYYWVTTIDRDGCLYTSDSLWIDKGLQGIIYPNPNDGNFKLSFDNEEQGKVIIKITTLNSAPVKTLLYNKTENLFEKDISIPELKSGAYFIDVLMNGNHLFFQKLIRQ